MIMMLEAVYAFILNPNLHHMRRDGGPMALFCYDEPTHSGEIRQEPNDEWVTLFLS